MKALSASMFPVRYREPAVMTQKGFSTTGLASINTSDYSGVILDVERQRRAGAA
jgi:hypothetical protein